MSLLFSFNSLNLPSTRIPRKWPDEATHLQTIFGQQVLWCPAEYGGSHLSGSELEPYRSFGDPPLDDLLDRLAQEGQPLTAGGNLLELVESIQNECDDTVKNLSPQLQQDLQTFIKRYQTLPSWVNAGQLERGRKVFLTYAPAMGAALYYRSLVPGFSIPHLAAVVQSTGYLAPPSSREQVSNRLVDTGAMISACMCGSIDSVLPGGDGWKATLHVRILHAKVRRQLLKRTGKRAWDTAALGIPINQEDMAATLLAFSINSLYGIEFIAGVQLSRQEQLDYLSLWRYIGWLLGVDTAHDRNKSECGGLRPLDPCGPGWSDTSDPVKHSRSILESIILHLMKPNESSIQVARHLLMVGRANNKDKTDDKVEKNQLAWFYFRCLQCRRFVGDSLADALQLPRHPVWWKRWLLLCASTLYLSLFRLYTLATMYIPPVRRRMREYHTNSVRRFYNYWKEHHPTRMAKALRETATTTKVDESSSCCPFAMVMPPQY